MRTYTRRIGPRMAGVVSFVERNPGLPMMAAAESIRRVQGTTDWQPLYEAVHRTIEAGLVRAEKGKGRSLLLYPV